MKLAMITATGLLLACLGMQSTAPTDAKPSVKQIGWIHGAWFEERPDGTRAEEYWTPVRGGMMIGAGITTKDGRVRFFEHLRIEETKEGKIVYVAMPNGRAPTVFPMTEMTAERVVFENPEHDFPTRISYWKDGEGLCAKVEGKRNGREMSEEWHFKRMGG